MLFSAAVVCHKSPPLSIGLIAVDTWYSCTDKVDRIYVMMIGGKAGARFWDHQSVLCMA